MERGEGALTKGATISREPGPFWGAGEGPGWKGELARAWQSSEWHAEELRLSQGR